MATLYADATGAICGAALSEADEAAWGPPPEMAESLQFDPATNQTLLRALYQSTDAWRLSGGVLYCDGQPVTINPDSVARAERQQALALARGLKTYNGVNNPNTGATVAAVKANNRLTLILARLLLREIEGE